MLRYVSRSNDTDTSIRFPGVSDMLSRLLVARGVDTPEAADVFLHPSAEQLRDPYLLNDMSRAVEAIRETKAEGGRICVYGDYDVDGVCASSILYLYLKSEGFDIEVYIPSRHDEGYGLNEASVREVAGRCSLLLTVDNGVAASELITLAQSLGMRCVVTDHHRIEGELPPCPTVNPLLNGYPFGFICGAGVAFKLVWALGGREKALEYVDLAALATVADVVPLKDENRAIVYLGLKKINTAPRIGVEQLIAASGLKKGNITSQNIGFALGPRLNAGGRLGSAMRSFELLTAEDEFDALTMADELEKENSSRREMERTMQLEALSQIGAMDLTKHGVIMVSGENWNKGVIGLMAGRLKEKFNYPVIALAEQDGVLTGSCRSIEGADMFKALESVSGLLERFGGHAMAAGLTLKKENFTEVWAALDKYFRENTAPEMYTPKVEYDLEMPVGELDEAAIGELTLLEPTGAGNPAPLFRARVQIEEARAVGSNKSHLSLSVAQDGARRRGICFGEGALAEKLGRRAEIVFSPELNEWNGRVSVQLMVEAIREADPAERIRALEGGDEEARLLRGFITEAFYMKKARPSRSVGRMSREALAEDLKRSPFGTWILCADAGTAAELIKDLPADRLDLCVGAMSTDARCFNALLLLPQSLEFIPRGVKKLVVCGAPALEGAFGDAALYELDDSPVPPVAPPDVDALREVFKAGRKLVRSGSRCRDLEKLCELLSELSSLDATQCLKGALILADTGLFRVETEPFIFEVVEGVKASPTDCDLYKALEMSAQHGYQGVKKV